MELNLAVAHERVAAEVPERECLIWRDRRLSWAEVTDRSRRMAAVFRAAGLGPHRERAPDTPGWESHTDHVALFLYNGNEYLETMLGAYKARVAPVNVNYRYTAEELAYVLANSGSRALVFHSSLSAVVRDALALAGGIELVVAVDDGPAEVDVKGVVEYEAALSAADPDRGLSAGCRPDDLYILYTGGTTGKPRGVLWRQADFIAGALGVKVDSYAELADAARRGGERLRVLPSPPFMHGAAHWNAWSAWLGGGTVVIQQHTRHVDPADLVATAARERVTSLQVVGDAFARPIIDHLQSVEHPPDLSALRFVISGGAVLSASTKAALIELLPGVTVIDIVGSSEAGRQGVHSSSARVGVASGTFAPSSGATVLDDSRTRVLDPGTPEIGWLATSGHVPLGYLGDPAKTAETFPMVDGVRYSVPGDRARRRDDGAIDLLGRDSVTINTGGEKVFAEEVEAALKEHPAVFDALVVGRPSERWGQEVVAVVSLRPGSDATDEELRETCARHLARYKLPKLIVRRQEIARSPSGKPDYGWARAQLDPAAP